MLVALVIVSVMVSLGFGFYYLQQSSQVSQLQTKLATDESQISVLSSQATSLQNQINSQASTLQSLSGSQQSRTSSLSQLSSSLQSMQSSLQSLQSQVQTALSSGQANSNQIQQLQLAIQAVNASIATVQTQLSNLQPQMPISTLVMTQSSYNSTSNVETFAVKNTWNGTLYAQLQVNVMCITRPGAEFYCPNPVGTYTSNVMQFAPDATAAVSFNLSQVEVLSSGTMDQLQVYFLSSATQVSLTYTLQYP